MVHFFLLTTQPVQCSSRGSAQDLSGGMTLKATRGLDVFPDMGDIKKLVNHEYGYRLRVGNWRILFNTFKEVSIVSIEEVKKRNEHTY